MTEHALAEERLRVAQDAGEIGTFEWYPKVGELVVSDSYRRVFGIAPGVRVGDALVMSLVEPGHHDQAGPHRFGRMLNPLEYAEYPIRRRDTGELRWIARRGAAVRQSAAWSAIWPWPGTSATANRPGRRRRPASASGGRA